NMESAIKIMTNISRIFKGKNGREIAESLRQFGEMGMSLNQSESAFFGAQRMGGLLNVDPSRIMQSGYMSTEMSRQSGLATSLLYATVSNYFMNVERMRQSGQLTQDQLLNFGGSECVAQSFTYMQMIFLNSPGADIFLMSIYNHK